MLSKTSIIAIRALLFLAQQDPGLCFSPRRLAEILGESPTYLAKVIRHLVRAGILMAEKGAKGGVRLLAAPAGITLLAVVEACQGMIVGNYCRTPLDDSPVCGFHRAAVELHEAITGVLGRWTLAQLLEHPETGARVSGHAPCLLDRGPDCWNGS